VWLLTCVGEAVLERTGFSTTLVSGRLAAVTLIIAGVVTSVVCGLVTVSSVVVAVESSHGTSSTVGGGWGGGRLYSWQLTDFLNELHQNCYLFL